MAQYLVELSLIEVDMLKYRPSLLAASALFSAQLILFNSSGQWTPELEKHTGYAQADLIACSLELLVQLSGSDKCKLQNVQRKFSLVKYDEVALKKIDELQMGQPLVQYNTQSV